MWVTQGTQRVSGIVRCVIKLELFWSQKEKDIMQTMEGNLNAGTIKQPALMMRILLCQDSKQESGYMILGFV